MSSDNRELRTWLREAGIADATHLTGVREDMPRVSAALDIVVSSSYTESFPNTIGEAMSSGVPCVATDVGESAALVGDTGIVVPQRDPEALASGMVRLLDLPGRERRALGMAARERIVTGYSLERTAAAFSLIYVSVLDGRRD